MPAVETKNGYKNRILASLPKAEIARLLPHLSEVDLPSGKTLMDANREITFAYFLETGLASVVVAMANGNTVETGITGNDGLVGFPVLLGTRSTPMRTFMQIPGMGFKIKVHHLVEEFEKWEHCIKRSTVMFKRFWCRQDRRLPAIACTILPKGWPAGC
jgi:hypothetical protein